MKEWLKFVTQEVPGKYRIDMRCRVDLALKDVGSQLSAVLVHVCLCDLPTRDRAISIGGARQAGIVV